VFFWVADKSSNYENCIELFTSFSVCVCVCETKFNQPLRFKKGSVFFAVSKNDLVKSFPFLETITIQITHPINCAGHVVRLSFIWKWKKHIFQQRLAHVPNQPINIMENPMS